MLEVVDGPILTNLQTAIKIDLEPSAQFCLLNRARADQPNRCYNMIGHDETRFISQRKGTERIPYPLR